ncbi:gonadal somatic cell derived factor isoform X2 [Amia ocellicauda]|uniref:gonadal somatic cell derived factor isoform X2 n=1 Tax=Amia ocellicauda TaxID=2972642 RepID=UPI0034641D36
MSVLMLLVTVIFGCSLGKAFILPVAQENTSPSPSVPDMPVIKMTSCKGESLQSIKDKLLRALNLEWEPRVNQDVMSQLRDTWKTSFNLMHHNSKTPAGYNTSIQQSPMTNSNTTVGQQCCQLVSQIFIKDLGWESWFLYPESFTYIQCVNCPSDWDRSSSWRCRDDIPSSKRHLPQVPCCRPVAEDSIPVIYIDQHITVTISTITLVQECGCARDPDTEPQN